MTATMIDQPTSTLDELAIAIHTMDLEIQSATTDLLEKWIAIGSRLTEGVSQLPPNERIGWVESTGLSSSSGARYMSIYRNGETIRSAIARNELELTFRNVITFCKGKANVPRADKFVLKLSPEDVETVRAMRAEMALVKALRVES